MKAEIPRLDDLTESPWPQLPAVINQVTHTVIGRAIEVHRTLGPGLPEKLYEAALVFELRETGLSIRQQHDIRVRYKSIQLPELRVDILVEDFLVLEVKAVEKVPESHLAQLVSYLYAGRFPIGLLINFHSPTLKQGIYRRIHSDACSLIGPRA